MTTGSFNEMLMGNAEFLKPFAITLTNDREKAKDLFQETLLKAMKNGDKYHAGTNIKAWLYTIMRNIFINDYRRASRRRQVSWDNTADGAIGAKLPVVGNLGESNIEEKALWKAVHELPEVFKVPFLMHLNGAKYQAISTKLGEPLGTIKSRIHFARKMLRQYLNTNHGFGLN